MILPAKEIIDQSYIKDYEKLYQDVQQDPEAFWENIANELSWFKPWNTVLDWNYPYARWFEGGQCNIIYNALDRHQKTDTRDKLALIWEGQPFDSTQGKDGPVRKFTYGQLNDEVCRFANALKSLGIRKGDRVSIYLPRIPEQDIAMLAVAKIGAIHSVVFSGFSVEALKNRIIDAEAKLLITCDGYPYGKKMIDCKKNADEAIKDLPQIQNVVVVKRAANQVVMKEGRDVWWDEITKRQDTVCSTQIMEATDPLYILYTSGSTGKPKGVLHSHGGYMVGTYITLKWIFNLQPDDIYFCTADAGWVTGHSYIVYSPLINGVTTFIYEGTPDYPDPGKWWSLIEKYKISKFYTAPTAIRALMRYGEEWLKKYDLSSLKILGSVGEPINPEAWLWYYKYVGKERCPIMDTWWQTETGMFMLTPLPLVPLKPGSCFKPFFGVEADVVDEQGNSVPANKEGYLVIKKPWPAMLLDVYNNPQKYRETYFEKIQISKSKDSNQIQNPNNKSAAGVASDETLREADFRYEGKSLTEEKPHERQNLPQAFENFLYFTGDSAKKDEDGYFWIIGRNDDVIKVSGHRLGSAELESAFVAHPSVAEAAVIGKPHEIKGESIKAFVILKHDQQPSDQLKQELVQQVRKMIGPIATPDEIEFVDKLPKTRSGKIMRRVLKAQELGQPLGDTSTLES